tara:strand:+ start:1154 stop:1828 length:675 start_codon:yes stop_codon:yes gene_type:complete
MAYEPSKVYRSGGEWDREDANFDTSYDKDAYGTYYDQGKRYRDQSWWRDRHKRNNQHKKKYYTGTYEIDDENEDAYLRWLKENQHKTGKQVKQQRGTGSTFDFEDPDPGSDYAAADGSLVPDSTSREAGGGNSASGGGQPGGVAGGGRPVGAHNDSMTRTHGESGRSLDRVSDSRTSAIKGRRNRWMNIAGQAGSLMRGREEAKFRLKQMYGEQKRRRGTGWGG